MKIFDFIKKHPFGTAAVFGTGTYLFLNSNEKKPTIFKVSDLAVWQYDDGTPGKDIKNSSLYAPEHLFAPNGKRIVRRYDSIVSSSPSNGYERIEIDSTGKRWSSYRLYDWSVLGGATLAQSHDVLLPYLGEWSGSSNWVEAIGSFLTIAQFVISFVPGIGTGINFAISAGIALAKGQSISEAMVAGVRAAVPGAPVTTAAFDIAYGLAKGQSISESALAAARKLAIEKFGPIAGKAFDIGIAISHGQTIQRAAYDAARSYIPNQNLREYADRVAAGQNPIDAAKAVGGPIAEKAAKSKMRQYGVPIDYL